MSPPFGSFSPFCSSPSTISDQGDVPISTAGSLPHCNLFFRALLKITEPPALTTLFPFSDITGTPNNRPLGYITSDTNVEDLVAVRAVSRAGAGVGIRCDPGRMGVEGSLGDIGEPSTNRGDKCGLMVPLSIISPADSVYRMFPGCRFPDFSWFPQKGGSGQGGVPFLSRRKWLHMYEFPLGCPRLLIFTT
jgi:hypothetical protein